MTTELATYQEQIAPLIETVRKAEQILASIEAPLGDLYNQAEQTGDETARLNVMTVWGQSQALAQQIPPFVAALQGGVATIKELTDQRDTIAAELNEIIAAIDSYDVDHPRLADLVELVEEDVWEYAHEQAYEHASEIMYDAVYDSLYAEIRQAFPGTSFIQAYRLLAALRGEKPELTDYRRELILHLLRTFEEETT